MWSWKLGWDRLLVNRGFLDLISHFLIQKEHQSFYPLPLQGKCQHSFLMLTLKFMDAEYFTKLANGWLKLTKFLNFLDLKPIVHPLCTIHTQREKRIVYNLCQRKMRHPRINNTECVFHFLFCKFGCYVVLGLIIFVISWYRKNRSLEKQKGQR